MRWLKRDMWKAGITLAGMPLLLVLMVWVPVSAAGAYEGASGLATPVTVTVQAMPTEDATVTALNKEKLAQEIDQLKNQNYWAWTTIGPILVGFAGLLAALYSFITWIRNRQDEQKKRDEEQKRWLEDRKAERERRDEEQQRWLKDQEAEREKRAEERFQSAVEGLSSEREEAKIGAAITLRTFLRPGYEQFYTQVFDLAVAHLRLPRGSVPLDGDPHTPLPLTTLSQALIVAFKEAFPLARSQNKGSPQSLDATGIQLDNDYLSGTDLEQVWMPRASLRKANLHGARLGSANLYRADFREANLHGADFRGANLHHANLSMADLSGADLSGADLSGARLRGAYLSRTKSGRTILGGAWVTLDELADVYLSGAHLNKADLSKADLSGAHLGNAHLNKARLIRANLSGTDLSEASLTGADLTGTTLDDAVSLKDTNLHGVKGLTKEQKEACKAKGAIIDEETTTSPPQLPVSPPSPEPHNDAQAPSAPSTQGSVPTPDTGDSGAASQPDPES